MPDPQPDSQYLRASSHVIEEERSRAEENEPRWLHPLAAAITQGLSRAVQRHMPRSRPAPAKSKRMRGQSRAPVDQDARVDALVERVCDRVFRGTAVPISGFAPDEMEDRPDPLGDLADDERALINDFSHRLGPDGTRVARRCVAEFRAMRGHFCGVLGATPRSVARYAAAHPDALALDGSMVVEGR